MLDKSFQEIASNIKNAITRTQLEIMTDANKKLVNLYFNIGKTLEENSNWGNKFIDSLSTQMKIDFPNIKGFSVRNIKNMKKFYLESSANEKVQMASAQIPWSHNLLILDKIKNEDERLWYMHKCLENGWSVDVLQIQIETNLYERQGKNVKDNNFNKKLFNNLAAKMVVFGVLGVIEDEKIYTCKIKWRTIYE